MWPAAIVAVAAAAAATEPPPAAADPWQQRAGRLVGKMTLQEKVAFLSGIPYTPPSMGHQDHYSGGSLAIPRLGIPALQMNDGPQGYRVNVPVPAPPSSTRPTGPLRGLALTPLPAGPALLINVTGGQTGWERCWARCNASDPCEAWTVSAVRGCRLTAGSGGGTPGPDQVLCWLSLRAAAAAAAPSRLERHDCAISGLQAGQPPLSSFTTPGGRAGTSTAFPSGLAMAATWDRDLMRKWGAAMGTEFRGKGANVQLGPGICLARVPNNGRNFEYASGEDPFLGYTMIQPAVAGIQGAGAKNTSFWRAILC
eukprot:COSAG06_NODE_34_length_31045_cov_28.806469_17_plen_311_part_00